MIQSCPFLPSLSFPPSLTLSQFFNAQLKTQDTVDGVLVYLRDQCKCGITSDHIRESKFICPQSNPTEVIYRARLFSPLEISDPQELVQALQQWVKNGSRSLVIAGFRLLVDQTCTVAIDSFNDAECRISTSSVIVPTVKATPSQTPTQPGTMLNVLPYFAHCLYVGA